MLVNKEIAAHQEIRTSLIYTIKNPETVQNMMIICSSKSKKESLSFLNNKHDKNILSDLNKLQTTNTK